MKKDPCLLNGKLEQNGQKNHDYNFSGGHKNTSLLTIYQTEKSVRFSGNFLPLKSELWRVLYMYVCVKMCHKKAEQQLQQPDKFSGVGPNILKDILCSTPTQHQTPSSLLWDCGSQALPTTTKQKIPSFAHLKILNIFSSWDLPETKPNNFLKNFVIILMEMSALLNTTTSQTWSSSGNTHWSEMYFSVRY